MIYDNMNRSKRIIQISLIGIAVNLILVAFKAGVGAVTGTDAIFDSMVSLSTLVAAAVSMLWNLSVEGWLGVVISVVILKAGVEILMDSLSGIIGARVDSELSRRRSTVITALF